MEAVLHCNVHNQHEKDVTLNSRCVLGRDENQTDLCINHSVLSRKHGAFFLQYGEWWYQDLGSSNGTFVNGRAIVEPVRLSAGDQLSFCMKGTLLPLVEIVFEEEIGRENKARNETNTNQLVIDITKREVITAQQRKILLKDIHLQINQGEMTLILGGSGAGKTTFVNAVMGYEKADGTIRYGNMDVYADYEKMKYEIGFVPQKDLLRDADTVYDTLYNAVQMKMPEEINEPEHRKRVEEIMLLLGLDKQKDTLVKKLSGGQRKRLSIAMEFAGDPQLFFLDEPDSGLDGIMARALMEKLREIAD
ncbi:MAG: ATP-binding cassette domain-containing protein, partial [Clostridia bacterium]|nr:ATP-binding cassette domain-containing protein [Clostridia bacterium]